jgi:hypothetical protein
MVINDPILAANVPEWLAKSKQVATGSRRCVLEDGLDVMSSSDEDDPLMQPDKLTGMYTPEMDPKAGTHTISQAEAARQRAIAQERKQQMILSAPRVESPQPDEIPDIVPEVKVSRSGGSSDDDTLDRSEWIWSNTQGRQRRNKAWIAKLTGTALALPAPEPEQKAAASSQAPADQPKGAKAPPRKKGQESPGTKVPTPMQTRRQAKEKEASRAGGLRPGGGSGQTDTCVAQGNPSKA